MEEGDKWKYRQDVEEEFLNGENDRRCVKIVGKKHKNTHLASTSGMSGDGARACFSVWTAELDRY